MQAHAPGMNGHFSHHSWFWDLPQSMP